MKYNETYEKIEAYLRGELSEEDRILFDQKIQEDNELAEQVHMQESNHLVMEVLVENDLRKRLKQWQGEKEAKKKRERDERKPPFWMNWAGALLGLLVLGGVCYAIFQMNEGQRGEGISKGGTTYKQGFSATLLDTTTNATPPASIEGETVVQEEKRDLENTNQSVGEPQGGPEFSTKPNTNPRQKPDASEAKSSPTPPASEINTPKEKEDKPNIASKLDNELRKEQDTPHPIDTIAYYNNLAVAYYEQGDYEKALEYFAKVLEIQLNVSGSSHPDVARSYGNLGNIYEKQTDYKRATEYYEKALKTQLAIFGSSHPSDIDRLYSNLGRGYYKQGSYKKAIEYHEKALGIQLAIYGASHPDLVKSYNNLRDAYQGQGEYEKASECHKKALKIQSDLLKQSQPTRTNPITAIIDEHDDLSRYDELWESRSTEELLNALDSALLDLKNKSYDLAVQKLVPNYAQNSDDGNAAYYLGLAYYEQRNLGQAIPLFQKAANKKSYGSRRDAEWILALAYLRNGQLEDGKVLLEEIKKDEWGDYAGVASKLLGTLKEKGF